LGSGFLLNLRFAEAGKTAYVSAFPETGKKEDEANKVGVNLCLR
jgi:hypothetical protein